MEARVGYDLIENYLAPRLLNQKGGQRPALPAPPTSPAKTDLVSISKEISETSFLQTSGNGQTQLVSEETITIEKGFRRTQQFQQSDGRSFTRTEEFTTTERGFRRTVSQQNASGSTTLLEEEYDREPEGTFRHTLRFTDATGETRTHIEPGTAPAGAFLLGNPTHLPGSPASLPSRGTQLDIQA